MTAVYDLFLRRVAEGRGIPVDSVAGAAEGRIFAGPVTKELHLVDEWGGMEDAIAEAKKLAHLDANAPVRVAGETGAIFDWFDDDDDERADDARSSLLTRIAARAAGSPVLADDPLGPEARTFVASVAPLAGNEKTVAALPFVLLLH
jgi:protease-4